jgi:hypothetical protein
VTAEVSAGHTDVPDDAHQPTARNEDAVDVPPDFLQLREECFVVLDVAKLVGVLVVAL